MARVTGYVPDYETDNHDLQAGSPRDISLKGWWAILKRSGAQLGVDNISIIAAGVAFNLFLAIFPLIIAAVSVYGLLVDSQTLQTHMNTLTGMMPEAAGGVIENRLNALIQNSDQALSWGLILSILLTLWAANRGTKAMFKGINIAYHTKKDRGFLLTNAITLLFTAGGLVFGGLCLALLIGVPAFADMLPLPEMAITAIKLSVWPLLFLLIIVALGLIYKIAPVRSNPQIKWVSVGSLTAAVIWIVGSAAFSYFVANFANYDKTYGSVAAIVVLMLWLFLSSFVVLLGAEINSQTELQTAKDTTVGKDKPMGEREAFHADHVAYSKPDDS